MLTKFSIRGRFFLVLAVVSAGFIAYAVTSGLALNHLRIGGPVFERIDMANVLVADVLPPPEYIVESHLLVHGLARASVEKAEIIIKRLFQLKKEYFERLEYWKQSTLPSELKAQLVDSSAKPAIAYYEYVESRLIPAVHLRDTAAVNEAMAKLETYFEEHRTQIDHVVRLAQAFGQAQQNYASDSLRTAAWWLIATLVISLTAGLWLTAAVMRSITVPLKSALVLSQAVASGDLTSKIDVQSDDELGQLLKSMRQMNDNLCLTVGIMHQSADRVARSSNSMVDSAKSIKVASQLQSNATGSAAASIEELSVSIDTVAQRASEVESTSKVTVELTGKSNSDLQKLAEEMVAAASAVEQIAQTVSEFVRRTAAIGDMTQQVREIAEQTNLLALNAAIEAARAGEQGRGFAVVADEVRKLAEKSSESASRIDAITACIGEQAKEVDSTVQRGLSSLATSRNQVKDIVVSLGKVVASLTHSSEGVTEIVSCVKEQNMASHDIAVQVEKIVQMINENHAQVESADAAAHELEHLATDLLGEVGKFKVAA